MTTKQIIDQMEKDINIRIQGLILYTQELRGDSPIDNPYYRNHMKLIYESLESSIRTLLESFGEEIIGKDDEEVVYWREKFRDLEAECDNSSRNYLRSEQRLKMKEIISSIGK